MHKQLFSHTSRSYKVQDKVLTDWVLVKSLFLSLVCMYACIYIYIYVYIYTHTHTHTHTHTYIYIYENCSVVSNSLWPHGLYIYSPWNSPGQNTGVSSLSLLQGLFPTQRSNPGLPHCRQILYQLSHKGSPRIVEWVAYPFSRGSSQPRNWTGVSCIAGEIFTNWTIREALSWMAVICVLTWPLLCAQAEGGQASCVFS